MSNADHDARVTAGNTLSADEGSAARLKEAQRRRFSMQRLIPCLIPCLMAMPFVVLACSDQPTLPGPVPTSPNQQVVKFWDDNAAVYWNGIARSLVAKYATPFQAIRDLAILTVAQYNAAVTAEKAGRGRAQASARAAISAASVVVLTDLFPGEAAALETRLDEYLAADGWPGEATGMKR